jgi:hypothetical protein
MLQQADAASPARETWAEFRLDDRAERVQLLQQLLDSDAPVHLSAPPA